MLLRRLFYTVEFDYNEADTCRKFVTPQLVMAGWDTHPHSLAEQRTFTDGRIVVTHGKPSRGKPKKADYILRYQGQAVAVVEAKNIISESFILEQYGS